MERTTFYYDTEGNKFGSDEFLLPITLFKGMIMTIHGYEGIFEVLDWNYHKGPPIEKGGLRIILNPLKR
jgi:hypothetical protein